MAIYHPAEHLWRDPNYTAERERSRRERLHQEHEALHRHIRIQLDDQSFTVKTHLRHHLKCFNKMYQYTEENPNHDFTAFFANLNFFRSSQSETQIRERKCELMGQLLKTYAVLIKKSTQLNPFQGVIEQLNNWLAESESNLEIEQKLLCLLEPRSASLECLRNAEKEAGYRYSQIGPISEVLYARVKQRSTDDFVYSRSEEMRQYMSGESADLAARPTV